MTTHCEAAQKLLRQMLQRFLALSILLPVVPFEESITFPASVFGLRECIGWEGPAALPTPCPRFPE